MCAVAVAAAYAITAPVDVLSPMVVAIVLGMVVGNVAHLPESVQPGLAVAAKRVLRIGIVMLGLRLSLHDVAGLGAGMIATVVAVVVGGILAGLAIGRALGVGRRQRLLIACGFSICGAAAVAALAGVLDDRSDRESGSRDRGSSDREGADGSLEEAVVTAVALVVVFGTAMIAVIPMLGHALGLSDVAIGTWAGASVHEVAQVVAIGGSVGGAALGAAVVVKLGRVLMLAPVMAIIGVVERRRLRAAGADDGVTLPPIMPMFVAGFLAMVLVRTTGLVPERVLDVAGIVEQVALAAAMFALGVGVRFTLIRRVGAAPLLLAAATTAIVALIGLGGVLVAG